jgi:hypothetical protein
MRCRLVADADGSFRFVPRGIIEGLTAAEYFVNAVGARRGLAQANWGMSEWISERTSACRPTGLSVLARAMRARDAGRVLARAAAAGDSDPLTDPDARLFVGLPPL